MSRHTRLPVATFALAVKEELCTLSVPPAGLRRHSPATAELHGLMRAAGSLLLTAGESGPPAVACEVRCERAVVARRAHRLFREAVGRRPLLAVRRSGGKAGGRFACRLPHAGPALRALGLLDASGRPRSRIPAPLLRPALAPALLRGFFLGAGSVDDPASDHHLELDVDGNAPGVAADLGRALLALGLASRSARRRGHVVVYLKDAESIAALLAAMGAGTALMRYEEQRIRRDVRGRVNRLVNAEAANIGKAAIAGLEQREDMLVLAARGVLEHLPADLQGVARARLGHPEASLRELGEMCDPPLGKSAVQRRVAALRRLARRGR